MYIRDIRVKQGGSIVVHSSRIIVIGDFNVGDSRAGLNEALLADQANKRKVLFRSDKLVDPNYKDDPGTFPYSIPLKVARPCVVL